MAFFGTGRHFFTPGPGSGSAETLGAVRGWETAAVNNSRAPKGSCNWQRSASSGCWRALAMRREERELGLEVAMTATY